MEQMHTLKVDNVPHRATTEEVKEVFDRYVMTPEEGPQPLEPGVDAEHGRTCPFPS